MIKNSGFIGDLYSGDLDNFTLSMLLERWDQLFGHKPSRRTVQHWLKLAVEQQVLVRQGHRYWRVKP